MNITGDITLFKTPLDSSYKNVFDDYNSMADYSAFLSSAFSNITISSNYIRSRRDSNGSFAIQLSGYSSMDLHDYNYIKFYNNEEMLFAFIISVESINDGANTKSCVINCKLDAWTNHYLTIKSFEQSNIFTESKCTFDGAKSLNRYLYSNKYIPSAYSAVSQSYASTKIRTCTNNVPTEYKDNLRVLWLRLRVAPNFGYYDITLGTSVSNSRVLGAYPDEEGTMVYPIGIFDGCKPMAYIQKYVLKTRADGSSNYREHILQLNRIPTLEVKLNGERLLEANYTFFPPFEYTVDYSRVTIDGEMLPCFEVIPTGGGDIHLISFNTSDSGAEVQATVYGYSHTSLIGAPYCTGTYQMSLSRYQTNYGITLSRYDSILDDIVYASNASHKYPFRRTVIYSRGNIITLNNNGYSEPSMRIDLYGKMTPSYYISFNTDPSDFEIRNYSLTSGNITISVSELEKYLSHERNRILLKQTMGGINVIKNVAEGNVGGVLSGVSSIAETIATKKDYANYPDNVSVPSLYAADDIVLQDDIIISYQRGDQWDGSSVREYLYDCHRNGYSISLNLSPTSLRRDVFDFDSFLECNIIGVNNIEDKKELDTAFIRGVRRWHIGDFTDNTRKNITKNFVTNVMNYERSLL